jgi:hypothetical protein
MTGAKAARAVVAGTYRQEGIFMLRQVGSPYGPYPPTDSGTVTGYSVSPALPAGLPVPIMEKSIDDRFFKGEKGENGGKGKATTTHGGIPSQHPSAKMENLTWGTERGIVPAEQKYFQ